LIWLIGTDYLALGPPSPIEGMAAASVIPEDIGVL
jgi:hypothetical protein